MENEIENEIESDLPEDSEEHEAEEKRLEEFAQNALDAVKVREKEFETGWWKTAERASDLYCSEPKKDPTEDNPYNILYSNTEVLLPSLYSATPKPDVRTRFKGMGLKPLPEMIERFLTVAADPAQPGEDCLDLAMGDAVLSSLVPGLGYVRIRYVQNKSFPLVYESGHFKTIIWGKASRWAKVPWVAFKHQMKKEQMVEKFGLEPDDVAENYKPSTETEDDKDDCCVYEFWDKETRMVYYLCDEWAPKLVSKAEDPLGLTGFFPTPGLLLLTAKPGRLSPTPLYVYYKNQAEELNRVTVRLNKVLSAIRVRGAYSSLLGKDLEALLSDTEMENAFIPAGESALLAQSGGFDKLIWMLPIERLIIVAQELYKAREAIKQVIYELTGISDIIRGSSVASETATAQDLKAKWGTVRLRKMQKIVADYARDLFRMSVDCGSDHIPPEKWREITQLDVPTAQEKAVAQQQLQYSQMQAQQMAMQAQQMGQPPQPPQPPDPKYAAAAQSPSLEELLGKIKSDANRTFVVNIQTSSTIDLDTSQDKAEVSEFMNAMGQLMGGLQPLMAMGPSGVEAMKSILISVCERFKFGIDVADVIRKMQAPPPPPPEPPKGPPPPSQEEQQVIQAEAQFKLAKIQADMQVLQAQTALSMAEIEAKKQKLSIDIQSAQLQLAAKQATIRAQSTQNANVSR